MTTTRVAERDATQLAAYRVASMLIGVGSLHFLAPKPFEAIVPAELPGSARLYTYGSGVAELAIGRCCCRDAPGDRQRWGLLCCS